MLVSGVSDAAMEHGTIRQITQPKTWMSVPVHSAWNGRSDARMVRSPGAFAGRD
jgi:hypothetical protein